MTVQSSESSHPLLSCTDGVAASTTDIVLLVGRVLLALLWQIYSRCVFAQIHLRQCGHR